MIFIETDNLNLKVPSKKNISIWTEWINRPAMREVIQSTITPKTIEMQWNWIEEELKSKKRILLEICDKKNDVFLGVVSLSCIDYENRKAQISSISPIKKNNNNKFCVYEARRAIFKFAFTELSLNKIYAATRLPININYLVKNMCIGFEIEGISHDSEWHNDKPITTAHYFITKSIFTKKKILEANLEELLSDENISFNKKKFSKIINFLQIK